MGSCITCDRDLPDGRVKYCSEACRVKRRFPNTAKDKDCPVCGEQFSTTSARKVYCSPACASDARDAYNASQYKPVHDTVECPQCGKFFVNSRGRKFCDIDCQRDHLRMRQNSETTFEILQVIFEHHVRGERLTYLPESSGLDRLADAKYIQWFDGAWWLADRGERLRIELLPKHRPEWVGMQIESILQEFDGMSL